MNRVTAAGQSELYKYWERNAHISTDDVLNKTTQEVLELIQALELRGEVEIFSEAGDVLANVISLAMELGCNMEEIYNLERGEAKQMIPLFSAWNEQVQALRGRYTRRQ